LASIEETKFLLAPIERALNSGGLSTDLRQQILAYNRKVLSYSSDQIIPTARPVGGRWFDDSTIPADMIAELTRTEASPGHLRPAKRGI
jgi:clorobiocin/coumermycin A biosynthesis protein CloN6/CouN6